MNVPLLYSSVSNPRLARRQLEQAARIMGENSDKPDRDRNDNRSDSQNDNRSDSHVAMEELTGQQPHSDLPGEDDIEQIDKAPLEEEIGLLKDALLRTRAEMDNLHKRSEREIEKSRRYAVESLLRDLVPVIDSLDQGVDSAEKADAGMSEGMKLTRKLLLDTLNRYGLSCLDPVGERFDPQWHEAMSMQPSNEHPADAVITVLQKGYRLHDRLVRPARVIVSRGGD
jgi:molecular chaperone GrpE